MEDKVVNKSKVSQYSMESMCSLYYIATIGYIDRIKFKLNPLDEYQLSSDDTFAIRLRKLRKQKSLSAEALGELVNMTGPEIRSIENEKINVTHFSITKLYRYFGKDIVTDSYSAYVVSDKNKDIVSYRKKNNIKYKDMISLFNVSATTYHRIESTTQLSIKTFKRIEPILKELGIFP